MLCSAITRRCWRRWAKIFRMRTDYSPRFRVAYGQNLASAARRHLRSAQLLLRVVAAGAQPGCRAVAGYLFGLSAELALKEIMRDSGMTPLSPDDRHNDPFYAHFPSLKTLLRDNL